MSTEVISILSSKLNEISTMELSSLEEPVDQQYFFIADINDNPIFEGFADNYRTNSVDHQLSLYSGTSIDLNRKITISYVDTTITDIIKDIIDTYCIYLWYDAGIDTDATLYTIAWSDKRITDIFRWCDNIEARQLSVRNNNEVFWDTFAASGVHITDASVAINTQPRLIPLSGKKYGRFVVYGALQSDGTKLVKDLIIEPAFGTYIAEFSELDTQAKVDAMALKISVTKGISIEKMDIVVSGEGFLETGQTVLLTLSQYSLVAATWYIIDSKYNAVNDEDTLVLTSAFYQPPLTNSVNADLANIRQDLGVQSERASWIDRDAASWDFTEGDNDFSSIGDVAATWYDLDISSIVGTGVKRVLVNILIKDGVEGSNFRLRTKGHSNNFNRLSAYTQTANIFMEFGGWILTDSSGKLQFYADPKPSDFTNIFMNIRDYHDA